MNLQNSTEWSKMERIIFRLACSYLVLYFLILDNTIVYNFPFLGFIHVPFQYVSDTVVDFVNRLFIHREYAPNRYKGLGDTSWFYIAIFSFFILAIVATIIWTIFDKRKKYPLLFTYLHTYSRYYLAINLMFYGQSKLFGVQFVEPASNYLIQPVGNIDPHALLWTFMAASKAYNFFGGIVETIVSALLFFRKTSTLGALIGIATLINVFLLNIGYDTAVKILSFHMLLTAFFIISPDIKRLFNIFILNKKEYLATIPNIISNSRFKGLQYGLKFIVIGFAVFSSVKLFTGIVDKYSNPLSDVRGIFDIEEFYWNRQILPPLLTDTLRWKKFAINHYDDWITVQYMNDSVANYSMKTDTTTRLITLSTWRDTTFKCDLYYTIRNSDEYIFEGIYKTDSIRFVSKKINLEKLPLVKDRGKVIWFWW